MWVGEIGFCTTNICVFQVICCALCNKIGISTDSSWQTQAQQLLDQQNYAEAGRLYREVWEQQENLFAGSRYLYCLRKAGYASSGIPIARRILEHHPENTYVRNELVWAIYESDLKPAKEASDLAKTLRVAGEILVLTQDLLPLKLSVFAVIDVAKDKMKWSIVSEWCNKLDPAELDEGKREMGGRQVISEREQWYFAKLKSLIQLEDWVSALEISNERLFEKRNEM